MAMFFLAAATAVTVVSQLREGQQMGAGEGYNARVAEANAKAVRESAAFQTETLKRQAETESDILRKSTTIETDILKKQSEVEAAKITKEKGKTISAQRAAYAKAGVRLDEGTPLDVMADTAAEYELDLATGRYNLASTINAKQFNLESNLAVKNYNLATGLETIRHGAETDVARLQSEAEYRRRLGKSYKQASYLKAGGTLLTAGYGASKNIPTKST